jgi:uncharacterized protein (TIGR02246 family)
MPVRSALRDVVPLSLLILAGWAGPRPALAQAGARPVAAEAGRATRPGDEPAIRAADEAFVRGYNQGDAKALAAMFTEDAEVAEADGARYQGRDLIERSFAETFAAAKGARIKLDIAAIRFLTPDVVKEEGRSVVTPARGAPVSRFYTVLFVRRDGRWLMASVREEPDPVVRPHDRLKELEWMVGDWVDEAPDHVVRASCRWSADGNFLLRDFTVKRGGKAVMSVTQRVGWDPAAGEFRSWEFDSEGGFGEGRWSRDGDRWVVKESGVRPDGMTASSTRITLREKADQVRWTLLDRVVAGGAVPGEETSVLTRVPPAPGLKSDGRTRPSPSNTTPTTPNTERSPR